MDAMLWFTKDKKPMESSIFSHHIVLRSKLDKLPLLSTKKTGYRASHLCDTTGCLSESHIIVETEEQNDSRRFCQGIFLHIYQHSNGNKKSFKYSCRKIKIMITDDSKLSSLCG
ncbi:unnamed protein product [Adineta steineri]|uniref:Zinc-binding loop region of homing endonuclease domain-containing protein n=1 Tax=Adineta steineri TaxID=433720 RepID=A0A815KAR0_9BILA|nr:unnamed protein product [Adineta steineri]CAF1390374.1 unnamed protein product [Adineta steineri]CAF1596378.1 unnamed protein product [Adineta steineri]CAF1596423.1 unnamed protein product [Adineta steineri]